MKARHYQEGLLLLQEESSVEGRKVGVKRESRREAGSPLCSHDYTDTSARFALRARN